MPRYCILPVCKSNKRTKENAFLLLQDKLGMFGNEMLAMKNLISSLHCRKKYNFVLMCMNYSASGFSLAPRIIKFLTEEIGLQSGILFNVRVISNNHLVDE